MNLQHPNSEFSYHTINSDSRFFPPLEIQAPTSLPMDMLLRESLLVDTQQENKAQFNQLPTQIKIQLIGASERRPPDTVQMPAFKRFYRGTNPGQIYDHAAIRFSPLKGSTLYLSQSVPLQSNYFYNIGRTPIVHAAAIAGSGLVHSAHIEYNGKGVLMPGAAFSGKSSLAMFAMLGGAKLISDDLVLVGADQRNNYYGRGFRSGLLMRQRTHNLLPKCVQQYGKAIDMGGITKYAYARNDLANYMAVDAPINYIVFPTISKKPLVNSPHGYQLKMMPKNVAMTHLINGLESTVLMPGLDVERERVTRQIINMVGDTPCMALAMDESFLDAPVNNCLMLLQNLEQLPTVHEAHSSVETPLY